MGSGAIGSVRSSRVVFSNFEERRGAAVLLARHGTIPTTMRLLNAII